MALHVLKRARAQSADLDDMEEFAIAQAAAAGTTHWETEALATLFNTANAIQPSNGTGYINGWHRAQAMPEAGVRRTVVPAPRRRDVAPGAPPGSRNASRSRAGRGAPGAAHTCPAPPTPARAGAKAACGQRAPVVVRPTAGPPRKPGSGGGSSTHVPCPWLAPGERSHPRRHRSR
jgi:hypothetical protein